ncbi:DUF4062 domain-containing protein [Asanoa siamensis]|uniref:ATPase n=1 Tax=Asanoa siamensis TaxID=926357 RepID=A0ABQ4D1Z3_9ACTN|nr:DUF4062 domain-containing protein [Asanoa siamensis]GIF77288.1 hypothetical protein Asi02nite_68060 [Asanoa siamensis]
MADSGAHRPAAIRTPDHRLRVFVSSTLMELAAERDAARAAIEQLRLFPVMFESGARPHPAQAVYRAYLAQSDIFLGIYAESYGWVGPGMTRSGLEDEFELATGMPRLLYVRSPAPDREPALARMLDGIKADGQAAYKRFSDAAELRELILTDLATVLAERFDQRGPRVATPPAPATALLGRDDDIARILADLRDRRLVVLTGAGGIGKTSLALAAMARGAAAWPDGVAFVDLAPVTAAALVPDALAAALGVVGQGNEGPLDALHRALATRDMLLVVDNFEHVAAAAPVLADLIRRAPRLRVLVTSRTALRVRGERELRVEALAVPPVGATAAELARAPALRLLVERVRDVRPGFALTEENAPALAELCRRLGGLPLALELAAAWMRVLTPDQMIERLYERLDRPGAFADLPDRQQTLANTVAWSYDLLPASARELFARLSVFAAPFTVDDVVAVCGGDATDVIDDLSRLLDGSLVNVAERPDGQHGFALPEPIRRYAASRHDPADDTLGRLHRRILDVLEAASTGLGSGDLGLRRLDSERPNLEVVLDWAGRTGQPSGPLLHAIGDVWVWMLARGHLRQRSALWQRIEALPAAGLRTERDRLALRWLTASRLLNDGAFAAAGTLLDQTLPAARRVEPPARLALLVSARAIVRPYTVDGPAHAEFTDALALAADALVSGYVRSHYGLLLTLDGRPAEAAQCHHEALEIARALGDRNLHAEVHYDLAMDALAGAGPADSYLDTAIAGYREIAHIDGLTRCLGALGAAALRRGDLRLAARMAGATDAGRAAIGLVPWPSVTELERRTVERVRAGLPAAEFAGAVDDGRALSIEAALAAAAGP